jgi:hypothetical protein
LLIQAAPAAEEKTNPCATFTSDVSHELAVARQTPLPVTAATQAGKGVPTIELDKLYRLQLSPQSGMTFAIAPARGKVPDGAQAGIVRFRTDKPGRYRVAVTSGHWVDIVDGARSIESSDFQRAHGCERLHKIVEFVLPGEKELTLQLSGSPEATVMVSVTAVASSSAG